MSNELFDKINKILAQWNPLDVPDYISDVEYSDYVNRIVSCADNYEDIRKELIKIMQDDMGFEYLEENDDQRKEINLISSEIWKVLNQF